MNDKLVSKVMIDMINYSCGNLHDIAHFLKVHNFARTIGIQEGLDDELQETLEITAILHDIACPLCRIKYGNTNGKHQEEESDALVKNFLKEYDINEKMKKRINFIICHHHTYIGVDGIDYQILLEADFLVNADESNMSLEAITNAKYQFFKTKSGINLLNSIYFSKK